MEKLKIGDKVCLVRNDRWTGTSYYFDEVVRLTKTQAVLNSGKRLINTPTIQYGIVKYPDYSDRWDKWQITTPEIIEVAQKLNHDRKIYNWFRDYKFSQSEKETIYNFINKIDEP